MDFIDELRSLVTRIMNTKDMIQTEEATKNAMVMPFIHLLGYNVFDPLEVTPELISDVALCVNIDVASNKEVNYGIFKSSDGRRVKKSLAA